MDWNVFMNEVHANAVEHGWWDEERSFGEIIALCHSELSEALEEYRAGRGMLWYKDIYVDALGAEDRKPEGIAVELADCIIRILDWLGKQNMDAEKLVEEGQRGYMLFQRDYNTFGNFIGNLHWGLSSCLEASYSYYKCPEKWLGGVIASICKWAGENAVDMEEILRIKHEYNKKRPYRHGGKLL